MKRLLCLVVALIIACLCGCGAEKTNVEENAVTSDSSKTLSNGETPVFEGVPYYVINDNIPKFSDKEIESDVFENYSPLDELGRCGVAYACISKELMPIEERSSIGQVKPSGWQTVKYDIVDGKYLYNRCHLIGFQLTGENANECNLITGTRYMNVEGMLPFENMVADYIKETGNSVLYRVTPVYDGENLVARGVQMEALSVEDNGDGICFNVYVYNNQPGITINYADGTSTLDDTAHKSDSSSYEDALTEMYILNINSKKIHKYDCSGVKSIKDANKKEYAGDISELQKQGYTTCAMCFK